MKESTISRCLVMLTALFASASTSAQENIEYYPEGTTWEEAWYYQDGSGICAIYDYYRSTVSGDTVIDNKTYKRVVVEVRAWDEWPGDWYNIGPWHWEFYDAYGIREDNGLIYKRCPDSYYNREFFAYDFNDWKVGKIIPGTDYDYTFDPLLDDIVVESGTIDSLEQITLKDGSQELFSFDKKGWKSQILGIGYLLYIFCPCGALIWGTGPNFFRVINFTRNGVLLYEWDPDQILGVKDISVSEASSQATYTLTGAKMPANASLQPGIYIKGGKKFVVK